MTSVFCTSTRTPTDGSTRDSASTASTEWKNVAAGAAEAFGHLDAHHAELEQLVDQRPGRTSRARPSRGRAAASPGRRTRRRCRGKALRLRPAASARAWRSRVWLMPSQNVIIDLTDHAHHRRSRACSSPRPLVLLRHGRRRCVRLAPRRRRAAAQPPRRQAAARATTGASRSSAPASTSCASTSSSPTGRATGHRSEADDFEIHEDGKPQTPRRSGWSRSTPGAARRTRQRAHPHAQRRRDRRERRERAHLRVLPRRLSRQARQQHGRCKKPVVDFVAEPAVARTTWSAVMYPLTPLDAPC